MTSDTHAHDHHHGEGHDRDGHAPGPRSHEGQDPNQDPTEFWDGLYGERDQIWSGKPNPILVRDVAGLTPGTALDLGSGEGGDAIWLAQQGWTVTGIDITQVALARAEAHAAAAGLAGVIDWQHHDLPASFPAGRFDLVSAQFLHSPVAFDRVATLRRAAEAVAPGGTLLVVGHAAAPPWSQHRHGDMVFPTPSSELADLGIDPDDDASGWVVEAAEVVEREGAGPDGQPGHLADSVVRLRRAA